MRIDLHTHSNRSDGTDSPAELIAHAAAAELDVVALTDHDTVSGWDEAADAAISAGISLLRGTEFSCADNGRTVHMLGYLFDPADTALQRLMRRTGAARSERIQIMTERLSCDFPIDMAAVQQHIPPGAPPGRPHLADALVATGCFPNRDAVFAEVLHPRSPYYVKLWSADVRDVVKAIVAAGGVPVYAHPRAVKRQRLVPTPTIAELCGLGLYALEADHRDHSDEMRVAVRTIAAHYGIAVTGSSDYHGNGKLNRLGENLTTVEVARGIVARGKLPVIGPTF